MKLALLTPALVLALLATATGCAAPTGDDQVKEDVGQTNEAVTSCPSPSIQAAAITKQIVSVAAPSSLTVELVTMSNVPYTMQALTLSFPAGFRLESVATTSCTVIGSLYKCRHLAVLQSTTACTGTGNYTLWLESVADSGSGCTPVSIQTLPFSLTTENFCAESTVNGG